jgi:acyl-coenzyme A thioesterase PaaI-like protein
MCETIFFFSSLEFIMRNSHTDQNVTNISNNNVYQSRLREISSSCHSSCVFKNSPPIKDLQFLFNDDGELTAHFTCDESHQGYDLMVHGGIIAAVIDASMAQCLMGHGVVAYTADLRIRYKQPLYIGQKIQLVTSMVSSHFSKLYKMQSLIHQNNTCKIVASSGFISG